MNFQLKTLAASVVIALSATVFTGNTTTAEAATVDLINNGDFETGNTTGWTLSDTGNNQGYIINNGTYNPSGPGGVLAPIGGNFDLVTTQTGPGSSTLEQMILLPTYATSLILEWDDIIRNYNSSFNDPLQEFSVSFWLGATQISEVFSTNPGDPLQQIGPNSRSFDVSSVLAGYLGQSVSLRFYQNVQLYWFNASVDNVKLLATVPIPAPLALFLTGLVSLGIMGRRRKKMAA